MSTETPRTNVLTVTVGTTHDVLRERLNAAIASHHQERPASRGSYPETDTFLASTSRYLAAASAVLLPIARRTSDDGATLAHEFVHQCRMLELALGQVKAKLYGEAHAIHRNWQEVWEDVSREFGRFMALEGRLIDDLTTRLTESEVVDLSHVLYLAEKHAPTRPHPYLPHTGMAGRIARSVAHGVDRFWDMTEGRMIPEPIKPHDREKDGLLTQYLLGDPHVDD